MPAINALTSDMQVVTVNASTITVTGLDPIRRSDIFQNAPEPPPVGFTGIRTNSANLLYLQQQFPDAVWQDPGNRLMEARTARYLARLHHVEPGDYERNWPFKREPFSFQLELFAKARLMKDIALAPVALGTGKTKMALDITADKFLRDEIDGVMIIAPNGVHRQWVNVALPEHLTDAVARTAIAWKSSRRMPPYIVDPGARINHTKPMRFLAFNVEAFSGGPSSKAFRDANTFLRSGRMALVIDESSRIKTPTADRTKCILRLRELAACRIILTGTPITKGMEDYFSQYQFLDPNIIGLSNFTSFKARYCVTAPARRGASFWQTKIVGYRNQEELIRKLAPYTFMINKDVLGLPPVRYETVPVPLTDQQRDLYDMMQHELIEDLRARRIVTPQNAAVRILRLQQLLCGRYYVRPLEDEDEDNAPEPRRIDSLRIPTLLNTLDQHDGQSVIWARFSHDIDEIAAALRERGRKVVTYDGRTSQDDRAIGVRLFKDGEVDDFVGNPAAGGTGVDGLQVSSLAIYYNNSFNAEHRWQSEGRVHRIGTTESVLYLDLAVPRSVDTLILKNLRDKNTLASSMRELLARPDILREEYTPAEE